MGPGWRRRRSRGADTLGRFVPDLAPSVPLAIFDLDRTLHAGSGLGVLSRHAFRSRLIGPERMARSLVHDLVFRKGASTDGHINSIAELALDMGRGTTLTELEPVLVKTSTEIAESVRPAMMGVLDLHRQAGHHTVLLSASPHRLVQRIAELLGFETGIGTVIEDVDGTLTGKIVPPMCYGDGKLHRLEAVIGWSGGPLPNATGSPPPAGPQTYAYADSVSDLPLLEAVEVPFVVAPDKRLRQVAGDRAWPILEV